MLVGEPGIRIIADCLEVPAFSQSPQDLPASFSIAPIDLQHPVLFGHGNDEITGGGNVIQRVTVQPAIGLRRKKDGWATAAARATFALLVTQRGALEIDMIERVPH